MTKQLLDGEGQIIRRAHDVIGFDRVVPASRYGKELTIDDADECRDTGAKAPFTDSSARDESALG